MSEYFDVLDKDGNLTKLTKERKLVHKDGDWHRTVHVWVVNSKNEVLLQKRSANKDSHPNMWDISSAGHISAGEDSLPSAIRELEEELGIAATEDELEFMFSQKTSGVFGAFVDNEISDVYLLRRDVDASSLTLQKEEVAEAKFNSIAELKERIAKKDPTLIMYIAEYQALFNLLGV